MFNDKFVEFVAEFQKTFDPENLSVDKDRLENIPPMKAWDLLDLRYNLIDEEFTEFKRAVMALQGALFTVFMRNKKIKDLSHNSFRQWKRAKKEMADALGDMLVVIIGSALTFGLDIEKIMERIHTSNMSKLGDDGKPIYREDGKVLKGPAYEPPQLEDLV